MKFLADGILAMPRKSSLYFPFSCLGEAVEKWIRFCFRFVISYLESVEILFFRAGSTLYPFNCLMLLEPIKLEEY